MTTQLKRFALSADCCFMARDVPHAMELLAEAFTQGAQQLPATLPFDGEIMVRPAPIVVVEDHPRLH